MAARPRPGLVLVPILDFQDQHEDDKPAPEKTEYRGQAVAVFTLDTGRLFRETVDGKTRLKASPGGGKCGFPTKRAGDIVRLNLNLISPEATTKGTEQVKGGPETGSGPPFRIPRSEFRV